MPDIFERSPQPSADAPNIVMVLLDDLGFSDFGCYGSGIATPHIDGLAKEGLRYNRFHVTAICSPTRACLMTGRNHHTVGMGLFPEFPMAFPGYTGRIPKSAGTLPRVLREAGYNTMAVGKWHLTPLYERTAAGPFDRWPLGMGFDRYYGFLGGMTSQWTPDLVRDNGTIDPPKAPDEGYHLTEDLASQAIAFVQDQQQAAPGKPFFLYFAPGAMHAWHQVPKEWIEPYRSRFDEGWETARRQTFSRQREMGVIPKETILTERPSWVPSWKDLSVDAQRVFARQMEVYAGFLSHTDAQIGRLMSFLSDMNILENTLVLLLSDNGASADGGPNGMLRPGASDLGSMLRGIDDFGGHRSFNHYGWGWAWAGNTPFKLWKSYSWLGGVRVPLIARWPAGIARVANGEVRSQFCHAIDLMPTILDAAGVTAPEVLDGVTQLPIAGKSILHTFGNADAPNPRTTQYFETMGSRAIYHKDWKATTNHVTDHFWALPEGQEITGSHDFDADHWSLYNLAEDFSEAADLAETQPQRLREMMELWWREAGRYNVLPLGDTFPKERALLEPLYSNQREYMCGPGGRPIATRSFLGGFRLLADIETADNDDVSGVIIAYHNYSVFAATSPGGWSCYVRNGRLIVTFNATGGSPSHIVVNDASLAGRHEVEVTYFTEPDLESSLRIAVDGREMALQRFPSGPPVNHAFLAGKLLVGRDEHFPISDDYRPPFPFTGKIHRVRYQLPPSPPRNLHEELDVIRRYD